MIGFTARAALQLRDLREHYEDRARPEAVKALIGAVQDAMGRIAADPEAGRPAPRPYPDLVRPGWAWIKSGRYWIAYAKVEPPVITGIFYDTADIPRRA